MKKTRVYLSKIEKLFSFHLKNNSVYMLKFHTGVEHYYVRSILTVLTKIAKERKLKHVYFVVMDDYMIKKINTATKREIDDMYNIISDVKRIMDSKNEHRDSKLNIRNLDASLLTER